MAAATIAVERLLAGDRTVLARAITLIESIRDDHEQEAQRLLARLLPHTGKSIRVGVTGVPGVGKSTFIEAMGLYAIGLGHKVAVLAVDPSSKRTGGSIMGDKTRMGGLAHHPMAYIRPSPSRGTLGGVARRTREAMLLCEAAGYDVIFVETVGVGQSETEVADMVDLFMLMLLPGAGDELQGIKKGIVELADLLVVNKADGDMKLAAKRARADYSAALRMLTPSSAQWMPRVELVSSTDGTGIETTWSCIRDFYDTMSKEGLLGQRRSKQAKAWMWKEIKEGLLDQFLAQQVVQVSVKKLEKEVEQQRIAPSDAALQLLRLARDEQQR